MIIAAASPEVRTRPLLGRTGIVNFLLASLSGRGRGLPEVPHVTAVAHRHAVAGQLFPFTGELWLERE